MFRIYLRINSDFCPIQHNRFVFITEMKSIYCAVRTGSLNKAVCASSLNGSECRQTSYECKCTTPKSNINNIWTGNVQSEKYALRVSSGTCFSIQTDVPLVNLMLSHSATYRHCHGCHVHNSTTSFWTLAKLLHGAGYRTAPNILRSILFASLLLMLQSLTITPFHFQNSSTTVIKQKCVFV